MAVSKGLGTYAGLITALAQYLGAVALFLEADDQALALGPLATATLTLYKVLDGRFNQAVAAIENPKETGSRSVGLTVSGDASQINRAVADNTTANYQLAKTLADVVGGQIVGHGVAGTAFKPGEFDREPPAPPADELRDLHDGDQT